MLTSSIFECAVVRGDCEISASKNESSTALGTEEITISSALSRFQDAHRKLGLNIISYLVFHSYAFLLDKLDASALFSGTLMVETDILDAISAQSVLFLEQFMAIGSNFPKPIRVGSNRIQPSGSQR
jgi:hypothetical protein